MVISDLNPTHNERMAGTKKSQVCKCNQLVINPGTVSRTTKQNLKGL